MKCPNCNAPIKEDNLYCEVCGYEINMVPDFEPEIENEMVKSIEGTLEAIASEIGENVEKIHDSVKIRDDFFKLHLFRIITTASIILLLVIGTVAYIRITGRAEYQIKKAEQAAAAGKYEDATSRLEKAIALSPDDTGVILTKAGYYLAMGNEVYYIRLMEDIIKNPEITTDYRLRAYDGLRELYGSRDDNELIGELLQRETDAAILEKYKEYLYTDPVFSYESGTYDSVIYLKITGPGGGKIYYTLDGSSPGPESRTYSTPIFLEDGNYRVRAVYENKYGVKSGESAADYTIMRTPPSPPEVDMYSGEYDSATLINVTAEDNCKIYYTRDGSDPNEESTLYTRPIPMPLGNNTFRFISVSDNGMYSDIIERSYTLFLDNPAVSLEKAALYVMEYQILTGKAEDFEGHFAEGTGILSYEYYYCIPVPEEGDFYMFYEFVQDLMGNRQRTGNIYAVSTERPEVRRATYERDGTYIMEGIDPDIHITSLLNLIMNPEPPANTSNE